MMTQKLYRSKSITPAQCERLLEIVATFMIEEKLDLISPQMPKRQLFLRVGSWFKTVGEQLLSMAGN